MGAILIAPLWRPFLDIFRKSNALGGNFIEEIKTGIHVSFDYFSVTFPLVVRRSEIERTEIERTFKEIGKFFNIEKNEKWTESYKQRFQDTRVLGDFITLSVGGPEFANGFPSCLLELKGHGCREFEVRCPEKTWADLIKYFVVEIDGQIKRIDIAIDDFDGEYVTFDYVLNKLNNKQFVSQFKDKEFSFIGNEIKGRTIQFGSHSSTLMLCIYEKLKQQLKLGIDCKQNYWVRYEMRFNQARAMDFITNFINKENQDLRQYIMQVFYNMLDLKEDNTRNLEHQHRVDTDPNWLKFLGGVEKYKMEHAKKIEGSYLTYETWVKPILGHALIYLICTNHFELYTALTKVLEAATSQIDLYNNQKLKKINSYLKNQNMNLVTLDQIQSLGLELKNIIEERKLPF